MAAYRLRLTYASLTKTTHCASSVPCAAKFSSYISSPSLHPKAERFGVPDLQQSIEKYLQYSKPLVSEKQWMQTCKVAKQLLQSAHGTLLQNLLMERAKREENWLFDWWLASYLNFREPVVVHSSPGLLMKTMNFNSDQEWLTHAAKIAYGVIQYKLKLESESLSTEFLSDNVPLCMAQYYAILGNCRIPGLPNDRMLQRQGQTKKSLDVKHFCVLYRNRLFTVEYEDRAMQEPNSVGILYRQLEHIVNSVQKMPSAPAVGLLTSMPRDNWAEIHSRLRKSFQNANYLSALERSLFVLCLDDSANLPSTEPAESSKWCLPQRDTVSALNLLHGNMTNSGNRWFDKTIEFIVSRDGSVGMNFEHTPADAGVHLTVVEEVYKTLQNLIIPAHRLPAFAQPRECPWELSIALNEDIDRARDILAPLVESVDAQHGVFKTFGSTEIKKLQLSPDGFFQIALQLAYARLHPNLPPPPTYESGSLRRFHLGRTDTIRSCSPDSLEFTNAMADPKCTVSERANLLRKAINQHKMYTNETIAGQAFDRHLLGIRMLVSELKSSKPDVYADVQPLFTDPTYTEINHYRLSTSQTRSKCDLSVIFGPVVPNGYGVCYNIQSNQIQVNATSFRGSEETCSPKELLEHLFTALEDMLNLAQS